MGPNGAVGTRFMLRIKVWGGSETFELLKALKQLSNQKEDAEVDPSIESQYKSI